MASSKDEAAPAAHGPHVLLIPYPAPGHMLPHFILGHHLAIRGIAVTILVSPKNLPLLNPLLSMHPDSMQTLLLPFPPHPCIPAGVENMQDLPVTFLPHIISASEQLYNPVLLWFQSHPSPPVAIISSIFLPWTLRLTRQLGIKRYGFIPMNAHTLCCWWTEMDRKDEIEVPAFFMDVHLANLASHGIIINSFTQLENDSLSQVKNRFLKHDPVWAVGPLLPVNFQESIASSDGHDAIAWLDSCDVDGSVVYVGFGSQITLTGRQMEQLAAALDKSRVKFIWSVKEPMKEGVEDQNVVPAGFEERVSGRGFLVKGWAPQMAILRHRAVGVYLTHCGWNSALEGLCAGLLLLAWPMQVDHYLNTKLLADEWGAAIRVCEGLDTIPDSLKLASILAESVNASRPERVRAMELKILALEAIKEGGSSYRALDGLVKELSHLNSK